MAELIDVRVPGDKSISHRVLLLAPLASGVSRARGLAPGADVGATARAMSALGVPYEVSGAAMEVTGPVSLRSPGTVIDCVNSGTTARLLLGLLAGHDLTATLDGDDSLRLRPMGRVADPLREAGAFVRYRGAEGCLPVEVAGGALRAIEHISPVASAQVKSALLLAGQGSGVPVSVYEPGASRDHTERMLRQMGVEIEVVREGSGQWIRMSPVRGLSPIDLTVPGDVSSASFLVGLALLGGAGEGLRVRGVGLNPGRTGALDVFERMGGRLSVSHSTVEAGEPTGDIFARPSELHGVEIPPHAVPGLLDEIPIIACLGARAAGRTVIRGAQELRVKETDRIAALAENLERLGVRVEEYEDGLAVTGSAAPLRGNVEARGDHRIAMAFGMLRALPGAEIEIDDPACASVSYPGYWDDLERVADEAVS